MSLWEDYGHVPEDPRRHMLMPNMAIACGLDVLAPGVHATVALSLADCPDCFAAAEQFGGIPRWCAAMQGRLAAWDAAHAA